MVDVVEDSISEAWNNLGGEKIVGLLGSDSVSASTIEEAELAVEVSDTLFHCLAISLID